MVGFSSASLFDARERNAGGRWNRTGYRTPKRRITQGASNMEDRLEEKPREPVSSKAGRTSETAVAFQIHSCKTRITGAGPLTP